MEMLSLEVDVSDEEHAVIQEISLEKLASFAAVATEPESKVLTVALVSQFFGEPGEEQFASILQQKDSFVELLVIDNASVGFNTAWLAKKMLEYRQADFGENSPLCDATVKQNPDPFSHSRLLQQIADLAHGDYVLILSQDEVIEGMDVLARLQAVLHGLKLLGDTSECGLLLPVVAGLTNNGAMAGDMPLDAVLIERAALACLPVDDLLPTVRLALNKAACGASGFVRLKETMLCRSEVYPVPEWTLFPGVLTFSCGNRLICWGQEIIEDASDSVALFQWYRKLGQTITMRMERAFGSYWGFTDSEERYIWLLQAFQQVVGRHIEQSATNAAAFICSIQYLLQQTQAMTEKKVSIVFLAQEYSVWPSLEMFYRHCAGDERYKITLVYVPFSNSGEILPADIVPYTDAGLPIVPYTDFDIVGESPDVVVLVKAYDVMPPGYMGEDLDRVGEALAYIPYHISLFGASAVVNPFAQGMDLFYSSQPVQTVARYFVMDSPGLAAHTAANNLRSGDNLLRLGHPRMDLYSKNATPPVMPTAWAPKLEGRTVFLYNSHHTDDFTTFFDYFEKLLAFFAEHKEYALIWRPHPLMKSRFCEKKLMTERKWNKLLKKAAAVPNIVCDMSAAYHEAFTFSHALLTDISSLLIEYMFLDRPILLLRRSSDAPDRYKDYLRPELLAVVEQAGSWAEISAFMQRVKMGEDLNEFLRREFLREGLYGYGTNVSKALADTIYNDLREGMQDSCKMKML